MKKTICYALIISAFTISACDDDNEQDNSVTNGADVSFMASTAYSNRAEIEAGQLAASKASHDSVRAFGQRMVEEHTAALDELESIADEVQVNLPSALDNEHRQLIDQLTPLSGHRFDSAYMVSQVNTHRTTIMVFEMEIKNGKSRSVRNYANKYLPHIRMHLEQADSIVKLLNDTTQTDPEPQPQ